MTNLIAKIAELRKLEEKATHAPWAPGRRETGCIADDNGAGTVVLRQTNAGLPTQENIDLICGLRNTAPRLLDALGKIQAGDAKRLAGLIRWQTINDECSQDEIDMLDRLHEMACKMEANHE